MATKVIVNGRDAGRHATLEGDTIHISKGQHRMSTEKVKQYKNASSASKRFDALTTPHTPLSGEGTITIKIADIKAEIADIGDTTDEYQIGRKSMLVALLWSRWK